MFTRNNRGQGLIETILSLPLMILFVTAIGALSYRALIFHVVDYHMHEALICQESNSVGVCKKEFDERLRRILFKGTSSEVRLHSGYRGRTAEVTIHLQPELRLKKSLAR